VVKLLGSEVNTRIFALGRNYTLKKRVVNMKAILPFIFLIRCGTANAQAWKDCKPNSMGPDGCDSMGPGGGKSMGPGGGRSMGPGGGQSMGPGGGQSLTRDRKKGLNPDTLRPYEDD
jgi:hypothetical protein